ncbi:Unannotated [Lentimonas sp. CC19]|nr:Unannotated [Lentimonas sp. CC10]CAA6697282.1 Unannotated [Lentimonas sp. CC19]CAA7072281.1 Unannotated [Lentimonas sp. CC11]
MHLAQLAWCWLGQVSKGGIAPPANNYLENPYS